MIIQIDKITEHKDGSATLDISYDKEFASLIKKEYKIKKITNDKDKFFTAITSEFIQESINQIKSLIDMFFLGVGSIAIAVGVIGIGNSIYMAVIERTKEIGTLRALGMQKGEVLLAFIFEGILLSIAGSVLGLIVGIIVSIALSAILPSKVNLEMSIAALFIVIIGSAVASYFPAKKASTIYPAEALVYE
jgi:putative ABC transport system permease protein